MTDSTVPAPIPQSSPKPESLGVNLLKSLLFSLIVVVVCAIIWGVVTYFTNTMYWWATILIGVFVSLAFLSGFQRVNFGIVLLLLIPCALLAALSAALGNFIFFTLFWAKDSQVDLLRAAQEVMAALVGLESERLALAAMGFSAFGAVATLFGALRRR